MPKNVEAYTNATTANLHRFFARRGFDAEMSTALAVVTLDELCDYAGALGLDEEQGTVLAMRIARRRADEYVS